jgi:putative FmdB family regulatory protein
MPTYDFECSVCQAVDEVIQSMDSPSELDCPVCNEKAAFKKVFLTPPMSFVRGEPTTIGQWADKNSRSMGRLEKQNKEIQDEVAKRTKMNQMRSTHDDINRMSPTQKDHWIRTGEKK